MTIRILIVDDEEPFRRLLKKELHRKGFVTDTAENGTVALEKLKDTSFDVILLDIIMPGMDGISLMKKMKNDPASPAIIAITGNATIDTAVEAMKNGAYDYISKPYKLEELVIVINRAFEQRKLRTENELFHHELTRSDLPSGFVGRGTHFDELMNLIDKIAPTDSSVLIQGESGTGKELVANMIWTKSERKQLPMIALNCSTFSENLMESELFGHEKGAFTSAFKVKHGLVETANESTLFLDEIGEMPIGLQAKLLRFLDAGEFRRVGGNKTLRSDVRVIAATNKALGEEIQKGRFREDLFYRLNVLTITLLPLRERKKDIGSLANHFLDKYKKKVGKTVHTIDRKVLTILEQYDWPGNVRELENVVERAVILCDDTTITTDDVVIPSRASAEVGDELPPLKEIEKDYILKVLEKTGGNRSQASRLLGLDRKTLYMKLKKYGLES